MLPYRAPTAVLKKERNICRGEMCVFLCMSGETATQNSLFSSSCGDKLHPGTREWDCATAGKQQWCFWTSSKTSPKDHHIWLISSQSEKKYICGFNLRLTPSGSRRVNHPWIELQPQPPSASDHSLTLRVGVNGPGKSCLSSSFTPAH